MEDRLAYARTGFDPVAQFRGSGLDADELDLRAFFGKPAELAAALADVRLAGPSLRGIDLMDEPDVVAEGYAAAPVWEGLALVDFSIVPHFESDHPEAEAAARAHAYMTAQGMPHRTLRDGEVIIE